MVVFNVLKINVVLKIKSQINFERRRHDSNNPIRSFYVSTYLSTRQMMSYKIFFKFQGIGSSNFVYNGIGSPYARCFYVGLKTAVSIGKNPKPGRDNPSEMIFMGILWIMGVFIFAVLIGKYLVHSQYLLVFSYLKPCDYKGCFVILVLDKLQLLIKNFVKSQE